jgi:DHA2 family multidrug resistance protein
VAPLLDLPEETVASAPTRIVDAAMIELVRPLVERAALVQAINEAWAMLAVVAALSLLAIPLIVAARKN